MSFETVVGKFWCLLGDHDWTSAAEEGIPPTKEQTLAGFPDGFIDYAKMYCKRCPKVYSGSP